MAQIFKVGDQMKVIVGEVCEIEATQTVEILSVIETGGQGEVWQGKIVESGRVVAVKAANEDLLDQQEVHNEACLLLKLEHPNIVRTFGYVANEKASSEEDEGLFIRAIIMEYHEGGELRNVINKFKLPESLCMAQMFIVVSQVLLALSKLNTHGYVHGDLKPNNILVSKEALGGQTFARDDMFSVVLADLGSARRLTENLHNQHGTFYYMAPEYFALHDGALQAIGVPITSAMDVWSFGIIVAEILLGRLLYGFAKTEDKLQKLHATRTFPAKVLRRLLEPGAVPSHLRHYVDIVDMCLRYDPVHRPSPQELLEQLETQPAFEADRILMNVEIRSHVLPASVQMDTSMEASKRAAQRARIQAYATKVYSDDHPGNSEVTFRDSGLLKDISPENPLTMDKLLLNCRLHGGLDQGDPLDVMSFMTESDEEQTSPRRRMASWLIPTRPGTVPEDDVPDLDTLSAPITQEMHVTKLTPLPEEYKVVRTVDANNDPRSPRERAVRTPKTSKWQAMLSKFNSCFVKPSVMSTAGA